MHTRRRGGIRLGAAAAALAALLAAQHVCAETTRPDLTLREARLSELSGDREGAAAMYAVWLGSNADSARAPSVLSRYIVIEQSFPVLLGTLEKFIASSESFASGPLLERLARLLEVAGRSEEARDVYLAAWGRSASSSSLLAAFLLSLEMNDVAAMARSLAALKQSGAAANAFLDACMAYQKGDTKPAREALQRVASEPGTDPETSLKALWVSYEIAARLGDLAGSREAARQLGARFPKSPEYAMARSAESGSQQPQGAKVVRLPMPGGFFSEAPGEQPSAESSETPAAPLPAAASPASPAAPAVAPSGTLAVQVGSFQMKENADDLIGELTRKGFTPTLRVDALQGKSLYRVLAGSSLSSDDARALLDRLHAAGFSGFLIKDK